MAKCGMQLGPNFIAMWPQFHSGLEAEFVDSFDNSRKRRRSWDHTSMTCGSNVENMWSKSRILFGANSIRPAQGWPPRSRTWNYAEFPSRLDFVPFWRLLAGGPAILRPIAKPPAAAHRSQAASAWGPILRGCHASCRFTLPHTTQKNASCRFTHRCLTRRALGAYHALRCSPFCVVPAA